MGYDRAIVTDVPGTTRDTVEARCRLGGVVLRLIDTAGLRESDDAVERIGVERSRAALEGAALALLVLDGSAPSPPEDEAAMAQAAHAPRVICLINKSDRPWLSRRRSCGAAFPICVWSAPPPAQGWMRWGRPSPPSSPLEARRAPESCSPMPGRPMPPGGRWRPLRGPLRAWRPVSPPDALLTDAEEALAALGELTGASVREDVTARIFERFCVGK